MRSTNRWIAVVFVANIFVLMLALAVPRTARASSAWGIRDCCEFSTERVGFCCDNCCWITNDCNGSDDCQGDE